MSDDRDAAEPSQEEEAAPEPEAEPQAAPAEEEIAPGPPEPPEPEAAAAPAEEEIAPEPQAEESTKPGGKAAGMVSNRGNMSARKRRQSTKEADSGRTGKASSVGQLRSTW